MAKGVSYSEAYFRGYREIKLFYRSWSSQGRKLPIIIVHGVGEHSGRYIDVGKYLSGLGHSVYAIDSRGNGRSQGRRGHVSRFDEYALDLKIFIDDLKADNVVILGHSLGGLIATRFAIDYPQKVAGIILSSPVLGLQMKVPLSKKILGYGLQALYPTFTIHDTLIPTNRLSHDEKVCRDYDNDPLVHRVRSARFFSEFMRAMEKTAKEPERLKAPALFLQAGDDRIVSAECVKEFYERAGCTIKSLKVYRDFYHEILNEIEKDVVLKDISLWLDSLPGR
ncbi:MAG: alpha/beta hydrolase [Candidatus Omnitrophica bacterium]|nr:alpha/beta hydrolase [Candidatus Omnitrophota bacterium]